MEGRHKMAANTEKTKMVLSRIMAVFAASGLSVIGAGAIAGVELTQAVLMAGIGGVATVIEGLSRAYLQDGKLTAAEIDDVFAAVDKKSASRKGAASK
jgi:hypothetical protein